MQLKENNALIRGFSWEYTCKFIAILFFITLLDKKNVFCSIHGNGDNATRFYIGLLQAKCMFFCFSGWILSRALVK